MAMAEAGDVVKAEAGVMDKTTAEALVAGSTRVAVKTRVLAEAVDVTPHVLTITRSGFCFESTWLRPCCCKNSLICWLSY